MSITDPKIVINIQECKIKTREGVNLKLCLSSPFMKIKFANFTGKNFNFIYGL